MVGVNQRQIIPLWPKIKPLVEKALDRGFGEWEAGDILGFLLSRDMQLWAADDLSAVAVTQITVYPRVKVCDVLLVGGSGLAEWKNTKVIENWAREYGCSLMRAMGRRGWARAVGWTEKQSIAVKEL